MEEPPEDCTLRWLTNWPFLGPPASCHHHPAATAAAATDHTDFSSSGLSHSKIGKYQGRCVCVLPCYYFRFVKLYTERKSVARLIKTQRQILGSDLKVRKTKQPVTGSSLYLSLKWRSCLPESQNETVCESCLLLSYIPL